MEGPRLLAEALRASLELYEVYAERDDAWPGATLVRPGALDRLGDAVTSQGVLAVVQAPPQHLRDGEAGQPGLLRRRGAQGRGPLLVLVDVADPGNAGTVLRTAEAAGAGGVLFVGRSVDPLSPKVVRASAGALFRVPFAVTDDVADAVAWLAEAGLATWATVVRGGEDLYGCDLRGPAALLLGSEAHGLAGELVAAADRRLTIPMAGDVESLNVAMAATVVSFEAWRQRRDAQGSVGEQ